MDGWLLRGGKNNWTKYEYRLKDGSIQSRDAEIYREKREGRWRFLKFLSYPRIVRDSIDVIFSDEVGERAGGWKGGCTGCGYDKMKGESMLDCLRRMEKERKF